MLHDAPDVQMHTDYKDVLGDMQRKGLLPMRREPRKRSLDESKRWYLAAVRGVLVAYYGFMEEEANRIMDAYKLQERLNVAPEAQLHMDIEDTVKEMKREGFFLCAFGESGIDVNFIDIGEA